MLRQDWWFRCPCGGICGGRQAEPRGWHLQRSIFAVKIACFGVLSLFCKYPPGSLRLSDASALQMGHGAEDEGNRITLPPRRGHSRESNAPHSTQQMPTAGWGSHYT